MTVWFITGASRGFGLEIAREALSRGDEVVATAGHELAPVGIKVTAVDAQVYR